jgi:hypothetical protein
MVALIGGSTDKGRLYLTNVLAAKKEALEQCMRA